MSFSQELIDTLLLPDGLFKLREHITIDPPQALAPPIGTYISLITIKSTDNQHKTPSDLVGPKLSALSLLSSGESVQDKQFSFLKKKRNSNASKSDSQFVAKLTVHDHLAATLASSIEKVYFFYNVGRAFAFGDLTWKSKSPLSVAFFKESVITCHMVNPASQDSHLEVVIGFSTGDLIWYSPISGKYLRMNKSGSIHKHSVTAISWIPGQHTLIIAAFGDGSLLVFDISMEDQTIAMPVTNEDFLFSKPPQNSKQNPRSYWKVASKGLTSIAFCPDGVHFAVTSLDGTLKVLNYEKEMLLDVYKSYFAALQCCAWSPDGVYIAAGGQDDLISIFGFRGRLMSRLQGHNSWVNSLAFDETECKDKIYRLVSGGEDNRICFWDFSIASLGRRKVD